MIHKRLQADIIRKDGLSSLADSAVRARRVCRRGVELGKQETGLRAAGITNDESREGEAVLDELLQRWVSIVLESRTLNFSSNDLHTFASSLGASSNSRKFS